MNSHLRKAWSIGIAVGLCSHAGADITKYGNDDRDAWFNDVGGASAVTTIGFSDFGDDVFITDQYEHLGVTFTDGNDLTSGFAPSSWPQDGWGLDGNGDIDVTFETPITFVAVDHPGTMRFELFFEGQLVGDEFFVVNGSGNFSGIISTVLFDSVVISDLADGQVFIDDLHFNRVPGPSGLVLLTGVLFMRSRIRRLAEQQHESQRPSAPLR